jgi:hypothetical protein
MGREKDLEAISKEDAEGRQKNGEQYLHQGDCLHPLFSSLWRSNDRSMATRENPEKRFEETPYPKPSAGFFSRSCSERASVPLCISELPARLPCFHTPFPIPVLLQLPWLSPPFFFSLVFFFVFFFFFFLHKFCTKTQPEDTQGLGFRV